VYVRTCIGLEYGKILRRGYDYYASQYRVQYCDGSDQWAPIFQCRAVPIAIDEEQFMPHFARLPVESVRDPG